ncbi:MAG: formyltransferase family protein [Bdellovibrionota bacterium]
MRRLLLCGEGHGCQATYRGLVKAGIEFDLLSKDEVLLGLAKEDSRRLADSIDSWIQSKDDVVFSSAYGPKISNETLERADVINVHYAPLPRYRGLHATVWAILNGEKDVGFTFHKMDEYLDSGPIFYQEKLEIGSKSSWDLMLEMDERVESIVGEVVTKYMNKELDLIPQNEDEGIFVTKRNMNDCKVDWKEWSAIHFERILQALVPPYPRPFFIHKDKTYEIVEAEIDHRNYLEIPGHLVYINEEFVWIKLKDGLLKLKKVSIDGEIIEAKKVFPRIGVRFKS